MLAYLNKIVNPLACLTIFLSPLYLIRLPLLNQGSLNLLDLLLIFFLSALGAVLFFPKNSKQFFSFLNKNRYLIFFLGLILGGLLLSWLVNSTQKNWTDGAGIIKSFYLLPILFGLGVNFLIQGKITGLRSIQILKSYALVVSLIMIISLGYLFSNRFTFDNRLASFFDNPNQLAMTMVIGILINLFLLINFLGIKKINFSKLASWKGLSLIILILGQLVILFFTRSAGAWLGLIVAGGFLFGRLFFQPIFKIKNSKRFSAVILLFPFLVLAALFFTQPVLNHFNYSPFENRNSSDSRLAIYLSATKILEKHWLWGIGPGNFQQVYLDFQQYFPPYPQWAVPHPHNLLLTFWLESGLLGLLGFSGLIWLTLQPKKSKLILNTLLIYFIVHGLVDATFWRNDLAVLFWFCVIALALTENKNPLRTASK